jgi:pimeloyl-ACP methyl ester carboxylesterase
MTNNQIILNDGRTLGFAEYGDDQGQPFMYFHGFPSSRLEGRLVDDVARGQHLRIIAPDRPGFGLSDFKPGRKLTDWPEDVIGLANALELDRFSIVGLSGGGPYAAVCACKISTRLSAVGIISGSGPADLPGMLESMSPLNRLLQIGRTAPWLFNLFSWPTVRALNSTLTAIFINS